MEEQKDLEAFELDDSFLEKVVGGVGVIELPEDDGTYRRKKQSDEVE